MQETMITQTRGGRLAIILAMVLAATMLVSTIAQSFDLIGHGDQGTGCDLWCMIVGCDCYYKQDDPAGDDQPPPPGGDEEDDGQGDEGWRGRE